MILHFISTFKLIFILLVCDITVVALEAHSDWIHLQATCVGLPPDKIVIIAEINELKSSFCAILSHCFSIY